MPKIVCLLSSHSQLASVMKNCEPFVFGPLLAIPSSPRCVKRSRPWHSSLNGAPYTDSPPVPVPVGSPVCAMNSLITRWKTQPS